MAQLFSLKANFKPNMVILLDADCVESLLRTVSSKLKIFGVEPQACITQSTVCMNFEAWELENLNKKRLINDFFKMYGRSGMTETSNFYMDFPVEALCLLDEALSDEMKQS